MTPEEYKKLWRPFVYALGGVLVLAAGAALLWPEILPSSTTTVTANGDNNCVVGGNSNRVNCGHSEPENEPKQIAVAAECHFLSLPINVPPNEVIHVLPLNLKRFKSFPPWGLFDIRNDRSDPMQWPPEDKIKEALGFTAPMIVGSKCEFSNHGERNIANVDVPMDFTFGASNERATFDPIVSPLDVGKSFVLYVVNDCPLQVIGQIRPNVRIKLPGNANWQEIALERPFRNVVETIVVFRPSNVQWVGETKCN